MIDHNLDVIIKLCSSALNMTPVDKSLLDDVDFDELFEVAQNHMLASMIGQILLNNGFSSLKFKRAIAMAQRKTIILENDYRLIVSEFESSHIWYMPLKGAVLKDFYPEFAMREMADIDLLFDSTRADDVKKIMENLEFQSKSFDMKNDDDYVKPPVSNFEMHRYLFYDKAEKPLYEYYKNVKCTLLIKDPENSFGYHFKPEDFYVYMIAHEYKHYNLGGTGLRSLIDTYVYLNSNKLDMDYVIAETSKIGIDDFEKKNRSLSLNLFAGNDLTDTNLLMLDYILSSGTYGTFDHRIENSVNRSGKKLNYITSRIMGPIRKDDPHGKQFRATYSTFFKYPILLPFLPIYRFFNSLKNNPKRLKQEAVSIAKANKRVK